MNELRFTLRNLVRKPSYAVLALLVLSVGIGVNATLFALLDAIYLRPLPIRAPERLFEISLQSADASPGLLSYVEFQELQRHVAALTDVAAEGARGVTSRRDNETRILIVRYVSDNYFQAVGIPMSQGRGLQALGDGDEPQVVISHRLWTERLGRRPDAVGSTLPLNDRLFTIIGVTAPGFLGLSRTQGTDVWINASQAHLVVAGLREEVQDRGHRWFRVVARVAPGIEPEPAREQITRLLAAWRADRQDLYRGVHLSLIPHPEASRSGSAQSLAFFALGGLVLLIACANAANLTLARNESRRQEMAIRAAVGAGRPHLLRLLLTECLVLCILGGAFAVLLASWLMEALPAFVPPAALNYTLDLRLDARLMTFTAALAALSVLLVGVTPALQAARTDIISWLKSGDLRRRRAPAGVRLREGLIVAQIALGVTVLIVTALLVRSFYYSSELNPGFDTRKNIATFYLVPGLHGYDAGATARLFEECRQAVAELGPARRASYALRLPVQGNEAGWALNVAIPGVDPPPGRKSHRIKYTMVGPGYFELMGTRILRGRGFHETDRSGSPAVAVVNEAMARRFWPDQDPLGRTFHLAAQDASDVQIVGIAENNKIADLYEAQEDYFYVPFAQRPQQFGLLLVETQGAPEGIADAVRRRLASVAPGVPILASSSLRGHMDVVLYAPRRDAALALGAGTLALLLGAVGVYGVISLLTARRKREFGVRIALGAQPREILGLVVVRCLRLVIAGAGLGLLGGLLAAGLVQSRLHGVDRWDSWSLSFGCLALAAAAVLASLIPAWRATQMDPSRALRHE